MTFKTEALNSNRPNPKVLLAQAIELDLENVIIIGTVKGKDGSLNKVFSASAVDTADIGHAVLILQYHGMQCIQDNFGGHMTGPGEAT